MAFVILRRSTLRFRPLGFRCWNQRLNQRPLRRRQIARIGKLVHPTTILHAFSDRFSGSPFPAGVGPVSVAMGPKATFAYVVNRGSNDVSAYSIASNGALTPVPGSPFSAGLGPLSVAVDPMAKFAYVANFDSNDISAYSIASNGALTPVPGSPFAARVKPASVAITGLMPLQSPYETENTAR